MGRHGTISFLSDYGHADEFVGVVKSVIRSIAPEVAVIDVCHEIPAHDVRAGALTLARAAQYLVPGVVLAVVDPGVGTARRAVALTDEAYHLPAPGPTFAGRDVFAPVAAHLCNGVELTDLGPPVEPGSLLPGVVPLPRDEQGGLGAEVLWVDRYGNAQLNVGPDDLEGWGDRIRLRLGDRTRVANRTTAYDDLGPGEVGLVVDSYGLVSVAVDRGSAAALLDLHAGGAVTLERLDLDDDQRAADGTGDGAGIASPVALRTGRRP